MDRRIGIIVVSVFLCFACDMGLAPPAIQPIAAVFPVRPLGGDPSGFWIPGPDPISITILDDNEIPTQVDSLIFEPMLEGVFEFGVQIPDHCDVDAIFTLRTHVYLEGSSSPLTVVVVDSISGQGPYEIIEGNIIAAPIQSIHFDLDTLGFSSVEDALDLITMPNTFNYMNIIEIPVALVFHLTDAENLLAYRPIILNRWMRAEQ